MSRRRTPRQVLGPTGGAWIRMAPGWYRTSFTCRTIPLMVCFCAVGARRLSPAAGHPDGRWDGAAFRTLWAAQTMVEGAGRLGDYRVGSQD